MQTLFAELALLPEGWAENICLVIADSGHIASIEETSEPPADAMILHNCALLPAPCNLHSHAFQRAFAGMTERRGQEHDSFWSWRTLMHQFLQHLTPEQLQAISALAYIEMLEAGYAAVGEFHYIHNQTDGAPYTDTAELSRRIMAAAEDSSIGLTHLPVLYAQGGCDGKALAGGQLRFKRSLDSFLRLIDQLQNVALPDDFQLGVAPHSLRAVSPKLLQALLDNTHNSPIHIHIAEQNAEVEEVQTHLGARPIEWLLANNDIDQHWCLVHATHMTAAETKQVAASRAVVGLCPITEANLGDGIFAGKQFLAANGRFGIGTDSNIRIALSEELRLLEYSQRYQQQQRNVLTNINGSTGITLYQAVLQGGAQALGRKSGALCKDYWADLLTLDLNHPTLSVLPQGQILDGWIFAADDRQVSNVWSAGRHCVQQGQHIRRQEIEKQYRTVMADLAVKILA